MERKEQHAHQSFLSWKQQHDAKTRLQAAQAVAAAVRKQMMWDQREMESDTAQKQAFSAWLRQKSRRQGHFLPCHRKGNQFQCIRGSREDGQKILRDDADGTKRLYQDLVVDASSEQHIMDAIKRGIVVGSHRVPVLSQLYSRYQKEWGWDPRPMSEADRKAVSLGAVEEHNAGGVLEPFLESGDPNLPTVKSRISVAARSTVVSSQK